MRKILVFGITGMLGHVLFNQLSDNKNLDVYGTARSIKNLDFFNKFDKTKIFENIDSFNESDLSRVIYSIKPDIIINCVGVIKQKESKITDMIYLNSLFPHKIAEISKSFGTKIIQISTDCVFSGKKGNYTEKDTPDAQDFYGRSKLLGEVTYDNHLTIRTSIFGPELRGKKSLFEWALSQKGKEVQGYKNAIFSGLSTLELSKVLENIIQKSPNLTGLLNISTNSISKHDLIKLINNEFKLNININSFEDFYCNRSLDNQKAMDLNIIKNNPNYKDMVKELK